MILEIDEERKRVALGLKQLQSDPWKKAAKNLRVGQMVKGKVVRIAPSCAFVELEDGIEGIIPIGEMSETRINTPEDVLAVGQEIESRIKQVQTNQRRITLSLKAYSPEREGREGGREGGGREGGGDRGGREGSREPRSSSSGGGGSSSGGGEGRSEARRPMERSPEPEGLRLGDVFGEKLRAARDRGKERNDARSQARARALEAAEEEEDDLVDDIEEVDAVDEVETVEEVEAVEAVETPEVAEATEEPTAETSAETEA